MQEPSAQEEEKQPEDWPVSIGDIEIRQKPIDVLSLSPALTEISFEFGFSQRIVGRSNYCDYPKEALELKSAGNINILNMEVVFEIKPDYIILQSDLLESDRTLLENMGITIVKFEKGSSFSEILKTYRDVFLFFEGNVTGDINAKKYSEIYENKLSEIKKIVEENKNQQYKVLYLNGVTDMAATPDTFEAEILDLLGLNNLSTGNNWDFDFKNIREDNAPDYIFLPQGFNVEEIFSKEILDMTPAYLNKNIININNYPMERRSPRMFLEISGLALQIYGEK